MSTSATRALLEDELGEAITEQEIAYQTVQNALADHQRAERRRNRLEYALAELEDLENVTRPPLMTAVPVNPDNPHSPMVAVPVSCRTDELCEATAHLLACPKRPGSR